MSIATATRSKSKTNNASAASAAAAASAVEDENAQITEIRVKTTHRNKVKLPYVISQEINKLLRSRKEILTAINSVNTQITQWQESSKNREPPKEFKLPRMKLAFSELINSSTITDNQEEILLQTELNLLANAIDRKEQELNLLKTLLADLLDMEAFKVKLDSLCHSTEEDDAFMERKNLILETATEECTRRINEVRVQEAFSTKPTSSTTSPIRSAIKRQSQQPRQLQQTSKQDQSKRQQSPQQPRQAKQHKPRQQQQQQQLKPNEIIQQLSSLLSNLQTSQRLNSRSPSRGRTPMRTPHSRTTRSHSAPRSRSPSASKKRSNKFHYGKRAEHA